MTLAFERYGGRVWLRESYLFILICKDVDLSKHVHVDTSICHEALLKI